METKRQLQIGNQIQKVISELFQGKCRSYLLGQFVTVSGVNMSVDMSIAKVYVSILITSESDASDKVIESLNENTGHFRRLLGNELRHQLRHIPRLTFFKDDTLEEVFQIEQLLKASKKDGEEE